MNDATSTNDPIRDLMRRAVAQTPPAPSFDDALDRAGRLGVTSDDLYVTSTARRAPRRRVRRFVAGIVAALTVGGGGYVAYANFVGPDGYDSPTAAAQGFVDAISSGDLLRASRALVPFEREHMDVRLRNVLELVTKAGTLSPNDLEDAKHITLRPERLKWRERPMVDGVTRVEVVSGHLWLDFEPGLFGDGMGVSEHGRIDLVERLRPPDDDLSHPASFVVLQRDGDWYVSLTYSVFDAAVGPKRDGVDFTKAITATGSDTPEAAATAAIIALTGSSGPTPELIDQLDPMSGEAFHRYLAVIDPPGESEVGMSDPKWKITGTGQWRTAKLVSAEMSGMFGDGSTTRVSVADCDDPAETLDLSEAEATKLAGCWSLSTTTVALVERDGRWYVDPIESIGHLFLGVAVGRSHTGRLSESEVTAIGPTSEPSLLPVPNSVEDDYPRLAAGVAPPADLVEKLAPCLAQAQTRPDPDAGHSMEGAGPEFPKGFWWCMDEMEIGYEFTSPATAGGAVTVAPGLEPATTTFPPTTAGATAGG